MNALARKSAIRVLDEYIKAHTVANADLIARTANAVLHGKCTAVASLAICELAFALDEGDREDLACAERDLLALPASAVVGGGS